MTEPTIIDPPVGPFSDSDEIRAWIAELENMEQGPTVAYSLEEAREWLAFAIELEQESTDSGA